MEEEDTAGNMVRTSCFLWLHFPTLEAPQLYTYSARPYARAYRQPRPLTILVN
jgi:hypothetical protein